MKKFLVFLVSAIAVFTPNYLFAQNLNDSELSNISFEFCGNWSQQRIDKLEMAVAQWKNTDVCIKFQNKSNNDISINLDYPLLKKDQLWDSVCSIDNSFEQYISNINEIKNLTIPAGATITKNIKLFFPIWIDWNIWWCVTFYAENSLQNQWNSSITTILRQWFPMSFFIWSAESIKNEISISNFSAKLDENNDVILNLNIENIWNLSDKVVLKWTIKNKLWWLDKDIEIDAWIIEPWKTITITKNVGSIGKCYWWLFDVSLNAESTPHFSFDITNSNIDPELIESKIFSSSTSLTYIPRMILWVIIFGIIVMIVVIRRK